MRRLLLLPALLLALGLAAGCGSDDDDGGTATASAGGGGGEPVTVTVGVPRNFGFLSTLWARDVQPEGVQVEYKYFPVFTDMLTALNSGKIDLTEIGSVGAVQSVANGGNVRAVAVTEPNAENMGLLVPKDSPAQTFADLKGKKIAFLKSTNSYISFLHQVKEAGLQESDFQIVEISGPPANKAFQSGAVDAYYSIDPNMADLVEQTGGRIISTGADVDVENLYPYVATTDALENKEEAIGKVIQAVADNIAWIQENPDEQATLLAPKLGFSESAIKSTYSRGATALQPIDDTFYSGEQGSDRRAEGGRDRHEAGTRSRTSTCRTSTTGSRPRHERRRRGGARPLRPVPGRRDRLRRGGGRGGRGVRRRHPAGRNRPRPRRRPAVRGAARARTHRAPRHPRAPLGRRRRRLERDGRRGLPADRRRRPGGRADPAEPRLLRRHRHPLRQRRAARALPAEFLRGARLGNALSERGGKTSRDWVTRLRPDGDGGYVLDGRKYYATGALTAQWLPVFALDPEERVVVAYVPREAPGVRVDQDWNAFGQRATFSGGVVLEDVRVPAAWVIRDPLARGRATTFGAFGQVMHAAIDAGIARGALEDGVEFLRTRARPWFEAGVERAADDPHLLGLAGRLDVQVRGAEALLAAAGAALDAADAAPGDAAATTAARLAVAAARAACGDVALEVATAIFDFSGASAADREHGLDRHWRNARTHTLHDPARSKHEHLGRHLVAGAAPPATTR